MTNFTEQDGYKQIGRIPVDSGLVMIGDPCYTLPDDGTFRNSTIRGWQELADAIGSDDVLHLGNVPLSDASALLIVGGSGDGAYPVYVKRDVRGRVTAVAVDFEGE